jgi:hypothetical protein
MVEPRADLLFVLAGVVHPGARFEPARASSRWR